MARKAKNERTAKPVGGWKGKHHRIYLSASEESDLASWVKTEGRDVKASFLECLEDGWSIKVSPLQNGDGYYVTVQDKNPSAEFGDHSFGFTWTHVKGAIAVAVYAIQVMADRGDLFRDVAMTMVDVLDFMD